MVCDEPVISATKIAVKSFRYHCGLRVGPVWDLDDVRQNAAMRFLETGDAIKSVNLTWNDFRREAAFYNRNSPGIPEIASSPDFVTGEIPEIMLRYCSERERAALCLAYECDLSGPEIAEHLATSYRAAKLLLSRGRAKVRKAIAS